MAMINEDHSGIPDAERHVRPKQDARSSLWLGLHLNGRAVFRAGLGAGVVFLILELLTAFVFDVGTPLGPAYVTLQGLVGAEGGGLYNPGLVLAGLFVHFSLSVFVLVPLAVFIHPWKQQYLVAAAGIVYGGALYAINFLLFSLLVPFLATQGGVVMLINYALFGMVAAWRYVSLVHRAAA